MRKCLICDKEGKPASGLTITDHLCEEHYELIKRLEDKNKKHHERIARKIRITEVDN